MFKIGSLYLIEILHQTTTLIDISAASASLYLIEILHQTTTRPVLILTATRCILLKFYIKPQPYDEVLGQIAVVSY